MSEKPSSPSLTSVPRVCGPPVVDHSFPADTGLRGRDVFDKSAKALEERRAGMSLGQRGLLTGSHRSSSGPVPAPGCQPSAHTSLTQPWPPEAAGLWGGTGRGREWGSAGNRALDLLSVLRQNDPDLPPPPGRDGPATKGTVPHGLFPARCCPHYLLGPHARRRGVPPRWDRDVSGCPWSVSFHAL